MAKIGEGYFQFSEKGLKELIADMNMVGSSAKKLEEVGRGKGLFTNGLAKDLAAIKLLTSEIRTATKQAKTSMNAVRELKAESARISLSSDRLVESRRAKASTGATLARHDRANTAASPSAMEAERMAANEQRLLLARQKTAIKANVLADPTTTAAFKKKTSDALDSVKGKPTSASGLRAQAQDIRDAADVLSKSRKGNVKGTVDDMRALAEATERAAKAVGRLNSLEKLSKKLTPEQKGRIRGDIRDDLLSEDRAESISGRQARREIESTSSGGRIGRRIDEIQSREDLTSSAGPNQVSQVNQEIGIAAREVAEQLQRLAQDIRETPIDAALRGAAEDLRNGSISDDTFRAKVTTSDAQARGASAAGSIIDDAVLRAQPGGLSGGTIEQAEILKQLAKKKKELEAANAGLTGSEKAANEATQKSLASDIQLAKSKTELSIELDEVINKNKELLATKVRLDTVEAKGLKLSKDEKRERKQNTAGLAAAAKQEKLLRDARDGSNRSMHDAADASRRYNFQLQQASYGVQDFVQVIGQTGLSGALRASANNMASFFGASGTPTGAIIGAVGTIAMIGLADAFASAGDEADSAEKKVEKLRASVERFFEIRKESIDFTGSLLSDPLGRGGFSSQSGIEAGKGISETAGSSSESARKVREATDSIAADAQGFLAAAGRFFDGDAIAQRAAVATLRSASPEERDAAGNLAKSQFVGDPNVHRKAKQIEEFYKRIDEITALDPSDTSDVAKIAAILDPANKDLQENLKEFNKHESQLAALFGRMNQSFLRLDHSLSTMESNVADVSDFDGKFAQEQADALAKAIAASARRIEIETERANDTKDPEEKKTREKLVEEEEKVFNRYIESLNKINGELSNARVGNDLSNSMSAMVGTFVAARRRLEESLSGADPGQRQAIMAGFDDSQMNQLTQSFGDGILSFTGEVQRNLFETQAEANKRAIESWRSLIDEIRNNGIAADDALIPAIEIAISKIGRGGVQENSSVTAIEGLHQKIQESLYNDPDLDLQVDLLTQIRDILGSKSPSPDVEQFLESLKGKRKAAIAGPALPQSPPPQPLGGFGYPAGVAPEGSFNGSPGSPGIMESLFGAPGSAGPYPTQASGQMSVPPPKFDYNTPAQSGGIDRENVKQQLKDDPDLIKAKENLRKTQDDYIRLSGNRKEREQDANTKLKVDSQTALSNRNMAAIEGRQRPDTGSTAEESTANARRNMQMQGHSDYMKLGAKDRSAEGFFGSRRGGTVGDQAERKHGFVDDFPGGRRGIQLTESQQQTLSSPASVSVPGESPEENRRRRVAERAAEFGPSAELTPEVRGKKAIRDLIDSLPEAKSSQVGPMASSEEAERFRQERIDKAGPRINADNVQGSFGAINPRSYAAAGSSAFRDRLGDADRLSAEADKSGIPLSVPEPSRDAKRGPRTQARLDAIRAGTSEVGLKRAEKQAEEKALREKARNKREKEIADKKAASDALRDSGLSSGAIRSRAARERKGMAASWIEKQQQAALPPAAQPPVDAAADAEREKAKAAAEAAAQPPADAAADAEREKAKAVEAAAAEAAEAAAQPPAEASEADTIRQSLQDRQAALSKRRAKLVAAQDEIDIIDDEINANIASRDEFYDQGDGKHESKDIGRVRAYNESDPVAREALRNKASRDLDAGNALIDKGNAKDDEATALIKQRDAAKAKSDADMEAWNKDAAAYEKDRVEFETKENAGGFSSLPSNVQTSVASQSDNARGESDKHTKNTSDKMTELVALLKNRGQAGGILIG